MSGYDPWAELDESREVPRLRENSVRNRATVLQILPATEGWRAYVYRNELPVVCFALVKYPSGTETLVGMVGTGTIFLPASDVSGFEFYLPPGATPDEWREIQRQVGR